MVHPDLLLSEGRDQKDADFAETPPREVDREPVRDGVQLLLREVVARLDQAALDEAGVGDLGHEDLPFGHAREVHGREDEAHGRWDRDDGHLPGQEREHARGGLQKTFRLEGLGGKLFGDPGAVLLARLTGRHQLPDERAIAEIRRHAARRNVRMRQEAEILEVRHRVAQRCRGKTEFSAFRQLTRGYGYGALDVRDDYRRENLAGSPVQTLEIVSHRGARPSRPRPAPRPHRDPS